MKRLQNTLLLALICFSSLLTAQKLETKTIDLPVSKVAKKKGMYVNTTLSSDGEIRTFISYDLKKGELGFDVLSVNTQGKDAKITSEIASKETSKKYGVTIPDPDYVDNPGKGVQVLRLVTSTGIMGKLKIQEGQFKPKYATSTEYGPYITTYTSVLRGYKFKEEKSTESDMRLNIYTSHCKDGDDLEKSYSILEGLIPNTVGYFNKSAAIAFMGRDARIPDKDAVNGANVVMTGQFDGNTNSFINIQEHVLKYNQTMVTKGLDGDGNRSVLVSTLNAPTSSSKLNQWQAKGEPYMTYLTMDIEGNVIDNVTFKSKSVRGGFGICGFDDAHYVIGNINEGHSGYYRWDIGKLTHLQIVKIRDGEVEKKNVFSVEDLQAKLVSPAGSKKGKVKYKDLKFTHFEKAPNGDILAYATGPVKYWVYQFDTDVQLKALYSIEKIGGQDYDIKTLQSGDHQYILFQFQNGTISQGIKKSVSRGNGSGRYNYMKNVTFSRVDELQTYARIIKINPKDMTCSNTVDIFPDVILGDDTLFKGTDGQLILPVRDQKRNYKMVVIN